MATSPKKQNNSSAMMLGVGLDSDGHKRITKGENFALVGGTEETHEKMTETAVKINEKIASRGKRLEEVSHEEFDDIAQDVGLHRQDPAQN
jgi:seryl-tRNA(Sec) selenium transferase